MALVTPANIESVTALQKKFGDVGIKVGQLQQLLLRVYNSIEQDSEPNINANADWNDLVALYTSEYTTALDELKALVAAI